MNAPSAEEPNLQIARIVRVGDAVKPEETAKPDGGVWTAAKQPEKTLPPLRFKSQASA